MEILARYGREDDRVCVEGQVRDAVPDASALRKASSIASSLYLKEAAPRKRRGGSDEGRQKNGRLFRPLLTKYYPSCR